MDLRVISVIQVVMFIGEKEGAMAVATTPNPYFLNFGFQVTLSLPLMSGRPKNLRSIVRPKNAFGVLTAEPLPRA